MVVVVRISNNECFFRCCDIALHHLNEVVDFSHVEKTICIHIGLVEHPHEEFFHVLVIIMFVMSFILIMSFVLIMSLVLVVMIVMVRIHACPQFVP